MAAARPSLGPNMDAFEAYFRQADLDRDGRISGAEAVPFFQGSNLPKHVLAQIWTFSNRNQTGYLGREEFFNALRLITVAQSGRELTPDIVQAALGPAAAKIPAPRINPVSAPSAQVNSMGTPTTQPNSMLPPASQMGTMRAGALDNFGVRGQRAPSHMGMNPQFFPSQSNHLQRPPQGTPAVSPPTGGINQRPAGGGSVAGAHSPTLSAPNLSTDWLIGATSGVSTRSTSQPPNRGAPPANQDGQELGMSPGVPPKGQLPAVSLSVQPKSMDQLSPSPQSATNDSRALVPSANGLSSGSVFGGDTFSVTPQAKQDASTSPSSAGSFPNSSNITSGSQNPTKPGQPDPSQGARLPSQIGSQLQSQSSVATMAFAGPVTGSPGDSQLNWPKITRSDIQKYSKVFVEVDKDRDGKITGLEARNLFLSWRLPREVLKQVWDLSDEDHDSMLSLREFCYALYLMERYREGRPLPAILPDNVRFDEAFIRSTGQPSSTYSSWSRYPGLTQQGVSGPKPVIPGSMKPPRAPLPSLPEEPVQPQQKAQVPILEKNLVDQLSEEEQKAINSKFEEATDADKKVQKLEKEIIEFKEKTEFYRVKMQELVLYKSRCDNRLNEITERVSADKREVEALAKKYEDKYKQVGGVASKLTLDEAAFRDIQEKKLELYNAIVKIEQGGTADGVLQDRADIIQSDLEELVKTLNDRCKQYGLRTKPTSLVELPFGWQPGIQEGAADWDEDWDKFNDEGFAIIKDLTLDVENVVAKPKSPLVKSDITSTADLSAAPSSSNDETKTGAQEHISATESKSEAQKHEPRNHEAPTSSASFDDEHEAESEQPSGTGEHTTEDDSTYAHSQVGLARSSHGSPSRSHLETQSDHGGAESTTSGDKLFDESSWGAKFDNDDADSLWGLSKINTKVTGHDRGQQDSFFMPGDFSMSPNNRGVSPSAESVYGAEKKGPFFDSVPSTPLYNPNKGAFFDSAPSTPLYNSSFSPRFGNGSEDQAFDRFSRFDSFSTNDGGLFPPHDNFQRFDSFRSNADSPPFGGGLSGFDSTRSMTDASFGGIQRFDSMRSMAADPSPSRSLARFDSIGSTAGYSGGLLSFDDADPFGSTGPFKSSEPETPRHDLDLFHSGGPIKSFDSTPRHSDNWNAF